MRAYVAGPMSSMPEFNYPAFHEKAATLRAAGFEVENPAEHFGGRTDLPYETYLKAALTSLLTCDGIVLLPGWQKSRGARLEAYVARETGIAVIERDESALLHGTQCWDEDTLTCGWPEEHGRSRS